MLHLIELNPKSPNPTSSLFVSPLFTNRNQIASNSKTMGIHQFLTLPPLKRFRLLQQQQQNQDQDPANKENIPPSIPSTQLLPSKKRIESRNQPLPPPPPPAPVVYSLPTKKRIWAFQPPDLDEGDETSATVDFSKQPPPLSPLDLNVKYNPDLDEGDPKQDEIKSDDEDDGILCAVCRSTDGDPSDPIVFCDGCDLMVHTTCYGNPLIKGVPEGDWFCEECCVSEAEKGKLCCCLCPNEGGGLKPTTREGRWAHIVCALLIPEVFFEDPDGREGINVSQVPKRRWQQRCYVCKSRKGCVIECSEPKCPMAFHITCGLKEELSIEYKQGSKSKEAVIVAGFCRKHTDLWEKQQETGKFKIVARGS